MTGRLFEQTTKNDDLHQRIGDFVNAFVGQNGTFPPVRAVRDAVQANTGSITKLLAPLRKDYEDRLRFQAEGQECPDWVANVAADIYRRASRESDQRLVALRKGFDVTLQELREQLDGELARVIEVETVVEERDNRIDALLDEILLLRKEMLVVREDCDNLRRDAAAARQERDKALAAAAGAGRYPAATSKEVRPNRRIAATQLRLKKPPGKLRRR